MDIVNILATEFPHFTLSTDPIRVTATQGTPEDRVVGDAQRLANVTGRVVIASALVDRTGQQRTFFPQFRRPAGPNTTN